MDDDKQYKLVNTIIEKYFDRLYASIEFIVLFYGAVLAFSHDKFDEELYQIGMFVYLLPIGTYVIGLLYVFNGFSIVRAGQFLKKIEANEKYIGWHRYSAQKAKGRRLSYGTACVFFLAAPIFDYLIVRYYGTGMLWQNSLISLWLPVIMYLTYFAFFMTILYETKNIGKRQI